MSARWPRWIRIAATASRSGAASVPDILDYASGADFRDAQGPDSGWRIFDAPD